LAAAFGALLPAAAQSGKPPFQFTDVDRKLLAECEALDRQFEKRGLVFHDPAIEKRIGDLGLSLIPSGELEKVTWRFRILRDPAVNAFALPNGSIYVNTGLLTRAESEDQVAGVVAHEIAHVSERHGFQFNRSLRKKSVAMNTVVAVAGWLPFGGALGSSLYAALSVSQFAIVISVFGYSRELEAEADTVALDRMRSHGRDVKQMVRMFVLLEERIEPQPEPLLFRTHDKTVKRIETLRTKLGMQGEAPGGNEAAYLPQIRPIVLQNLRLDLDSRRYRSAVATAARLARIAPNDPEALTWLGESYSALGPRKPRLGPDELKYWSQRRAYLDEHDRPEQEQAARLAAKPEGKAALAESRDKAEEAFRKAIAADPSFARAYAGLGMLLQDQGKNAEALTAYRKYLELAGNAPDRLRIERRIESLGKGAAR
jgi:predicted Zn-dependent protease